MAYVPGSLYYYRPNSAAAIVFAVLFAISGLVHIIQLIKYKNWRIMFPVVIGAILFVAGFIIRAVAHDHYTSLGIFIASQVCLLDAPPVYALCLYFVLGRTLYYIPYLAPIHPGRVRTTFVALDGVCGGLIGSGAARIGNTGLSPEEREVGLILIKTGLVLQCVLMLGFVFLTAVFHRRCVRDGLGAKVRWIMVSIYVGSGCVLFRSVFRVVEFFEGYTGELYSHEAYFYCLDVLVMLFASVNLHIFHPGRFLPQSFKVYLARDGVTEREGPGWKDNRHVLLTIIDPFDLFGVYTGRDAKEKFWEHEVPGCSERLPSSA